MIELFEIEGGVTLRGYRASGSRQDPTDHGRHTRQ